MKKPLLSLSLIIAFAIYAVYLRMGGSDARNIYVAPGITAPATSYSPNSELQSGAPGVRPPAAPRHNFGEDYEDSEDENPRTVSRKIPLIQAPQGTALKSDNNSGKSAVSTPATPAPRGLYRGGEYTGDVADAYYGNVQVRVVIQNGKIADVRFLDYPQDRRTSVRINTIAVPQLTSEAIQAQSATVDIISGATQTSRAFVESLNSALARAKN